MDRELSQEIQSHLAEATEEYVRRGLPPSEARLTALRQFGGVTQVEEAYREHRTFRPLEDLGRDLRYGLRALWRSRGFSSVVVVVLSLGIGGITTVFTLLNRIVFQPLPFRDADRIVVLTHSAPGVNLDNVGLSSGLYFHYREHAGSFTALGAYSRAASTFRPEGASAERVKIVYTSSSVFEILGVAPALGRTFTIHDGAPGFLNTTWAVPVLLSHDFWVSHFAGDAGVLGRNITIGNNPREVIGVMPSGFGFPDADTQIWILNEPPEATARFARVFGLDAIGRLRPGVTPEQARSELQTILPAIIGRYPDATAARVAEVQLRPTVLRLKTAVLADIGHVLWTVFGGMALLLAIAWTNAAALFAVRADERQREISVRQALGAPRSRIVRLLVIEAAILTTTAAALGLVLARGLLLAVIAFAPQALPRADEIRLGGPEVAFAGLLGVVLACFYGMRGTRPQHDGTVSHLAGGRRLTATRDTWLGVDPVIALQIALALTLMIGSALMVKTYRNLLQRDLGFSADRLLTVQVSIPGSKARQHAQIYEALVASIRQLPGVESAAAASFLPLTPGEDRYPVTAGAAPVPFKFFVPGYFQTMATPIVEGEPFGPTARVTTASPVLVSAALARRLYPTESAIGKTVRRLNADGSIVEMGPRGPVPPFVIVGIVGDVRETSPRDNPTEIVYIPVIEPAVEPSIVPTNMTVVVRTRVPPMSLAASVKESAMRVDPSISIGGVETMDAIVGSARAKEAFVGLLLMLAAIVSVLLGTIGVYGSVAQLVKRRTPEIGIRLTLGARRTAVVQMVVAGALRAVLVGAAVGSVAAVTSTGALRSMLFGVEPNDPTVFLTVGALLVAAAAVAAFAAAARAARVDLVVALRAD